MRATFALLANLEVYNLVRKLAWEIHSKYQTGTIHLRLPPHISLKQPFNITDLSALEAYMGEFASTINPFEVELTQIEIEPITFNGTDYGLMWLRVQENEGLRQLHNRLNDELSQRFGDTHAAYDGADYRFHMTVMIGGQPFDTYRRFYSGLADPVINLRYIVRYLAMFVYAQPSGPTIDYLCYKILPIGHDNL